MKQRAFLLELVLDIAIFLSAAAVCLSMGLKSSELAEESARACAGMRAAQYAAERIRAGGKPSDVAAESADIVRDNSLSLRIEPVIPDRSFKIVVSDGNNESLFEIEEVFSRGLQEP